MARDPRSSGAVRILAQPAFTRRELNPYNWQLYTSLQAAGAEVEEFSTRTALRGGHDVWHVHWPEVEAGFLRRRSRRIALQRSSRLLALLWLARARGTRVVWTAHNLCSHERHLARLEDAFWRAFLRQVDGVICLSQRSAELLLERYPALDGRPRFVIPHGHYRLAYPRDVTRAEARSALGIAPDAPVVALVGHLREYKNVPALIAAVRELTDPALRLVVAGRPASAALAARLCDAAAPDDRIQLHLRLIPEAEVQRFLLAADLVVLPYREIVNSGAALLALSFDVPVLVPAAGSLPELQHAVGTSWVRLYQGELTADVLRQAIVWARGAGRPDRAPLDAFAWDAIADATLAAFAAVRNQARRREATDRPPPRPAAPGVAADVTPPRAEAS